MKNLELITLVAYHQLLSLIYSKPFEYYETQDILFNSTFNHLQNASGTCGCDLKVGTCDAFCCCDAECNKSINRTLEWMFYHQCWINPAASQRFPKCYYKDRTASISDLFSPVRVLSQNYKKGLCVVYDNSGLNNTYRSDLFINTTSDLSEFINSVKIQADEQDFPTPSNLLEAYLNNSLGSLISSKGLTEKSFLGYDIGTPILISTRLTEYNIIGYELFKFPTKNPYGVCNLEGSYMKYQKPEKVSCGHKFV